MACLLLLQVACLLLLLLLQVARLLLSVGTWQASFYVMMLQVLKVNSALCPGVGRLVNRAMGPFLHMLIITQIKSHKKGRKVRASCMKRVIGGKWMTVSSFSTHSLLLTWRPQVQAHPHTTPHSLLFDQRVADALGSSKFRSPRVYTLEIQRGSTRGMSNKGVGFTYGKGCAKTYGGYVSYVQDRKHTTPSAKYAAYILSKIG